MNSKQILVLGAGANGLTTALVLRRRGWNVTVIAERFAPQVTSSVAGALWEWPPGVCGKHVDLERSRSWAAASLRNFTELAADPATGVFVRPVTFYFRHDLANDAFQREKMAGLAKVARGFRHDSAMIRENGIGSREEFRDAYRHLAPMIDTDRYLKWLMDTVTSVVQVSNLHTKAASEPTEGFLRSTAEGSLCKLETCTTVIARRIPAPLADHAEGLLKEFGADAIVNCTGFGARELAADPAVYPLRGAVIRVRNDGRAMPRIEEAHCVSHDGVSRDPGFVFIVPRGTDMLLLGGFAEPGEENLALTLDSEEVRKVFRRCVEFLPQLKHAEIDAVEPLRAGLRPGRDGGVRLAWDESLPILHNYGHGGSGLTYSWGCAEETARLLER